MALKDELIQKALRRTKILPKKDTNSKYTHFKIYETPSIIENSPINEIKPDTNRAQNGHNAEHKPDTILSTNRTQTDYKKNYSFINGTQTEHEIGHVEGHKPSTNRAQTGHKIDDEETFPFSSFVGIQRNILFLLYHDCKNRRSKETQEFSLQNIAANLKIRLGSVKTSIRRLEEKKSIKRVKFKIGRSGWSSYELKDHIYREIMQYESTHKSITNWTQTEHKPDTKPDTFASSSSSFKELKTTTTEIVEGSTSNDWLKDIDVEPLSHIGLSIHYLKQISFQKTNLTPEMIQESIYTFAFDLIENNKAQKIKEPVGYFMSILKKGIPYAPPANYESPKDKAMRIFLERKKEVEKKRLEMEAEALKIACDEWVNTLSPEEQDALVPEDHRKLQGLRMATIRTYFKENIWPTKKEAFFSKG